MRIANMEIVEDIVSPTALVHIYIVYAACSIVNFDVMSPKYIHAYAQASLEPSTPTLPWKD
jgi:hypothetical protein